MDLQKKTKSSLEPIFCVLIFCRGFKGLKWYGPYRNPYISKPFVNIYRFSFNIPSLKLVPQK